MGSAPFILAELTDEDADWLAGQGRVDRIERGLPLIHQGERLEAVYVVLKGRFGVAQIGEVRDLAAVGAGDMVGEMSFLEARLPSADVRAAADDCHVLRVPRDVLQHRLQTDPALASRFYRGLARTLSARLRAAVSALADRPGGGEAEVDPDAERLLGRAHARLQRLLAREGLAE